MGTGWVCGRVKSEEDAFAVEIHFGSQTQEGNSGGSEGVKIG